MMTKTIFAVTLCAMTVPALAFAQPADRQQRGPDLGAVANHLGVSEAAIETCMPRQAQGERSERPDLNALALCLQNAGSPLTADQIVQVLEENRPQRPPQQG